MDQGLINGRFQVLRKIGSGSTGMVFSAWDHHLDRLVAVKILRRECLAQRDVHDRFEKEIRVTARLDHPGVVAVFESFALDTDQIGFVMSMATGRTLDEYLNDLRRSHDPWKTSNLVDRLTLFIQILDVISYAHTQGVIHRDLKPSNIVLGEHGEVRILDWGLARVLREPVLPSEVTGIDSTPDVFAGAGLPVEAPEDQATVIHAEDPVPDSEAATRLLHHLPALEPDQRSVAEAESTRPTAGNAPVTGISSPPPITASVTRPVSESYAASNQIVRPGTTATHANTGTSTRRARVRSERSTQFGAVLGSPAYMSPEQARGQAGAVDERADIYSLGVILVELLSLHTPIERHHDESLDDFIKRVEHGERRKLLELWASAPPSLEGITEWALGLRPEDRYPDCATFRRELRAILDHLSASFSELERQRLEAERIGTWLTIGHWDYLAAPGLVPFTEPVIAYLAEGIGQVMHPELGGLLLGGPGLQIYPLAVNLNEEVRISVDITLHRGHEFRIFARGAPPGSWYAFIVGAYDGKWLTVVRCLAEEQLLNPEPLTLRPLERTSTWFRRDGSRGSRRHSVVIEVVGSTLRMTLDHGDPLVVNDPCPLSGIHNHQVAFGTNDSQIVVHQATLEQRRSPLMVPAYKVANELLRQNHYPQAIEHFRRFLGEHQGNEHAIEARFMLCLAYLQAGRITQAEEDLRAFLSNHLDHDLAQDAIFELARVPLTGSDGPMGRRIERAVRTVLGYQESRDLVRARFCLWIVNILQQQVQESGLTSDLVEGLRILRHLIRGFNDEDLILATMAHVLNPALSAFADRLLDLEAYLQIEAHLGSMSICREMGYPFLTEGLHTPAQYLTTSRAIGSASGPTRVTQYTDHLADYLTLRDLLALLALGCGEAILQTLMAQEPRPVLRILRAALLAQTGQRDQMEIDLQFCFRLMDVIEVERTSLEISCTARLAFFGLGYLPWNVVWEPIARTHRGQHLQAVAAFLAECLGHEAEAAMAWRHLHQVGSGYCQVAAQGLARIGHAV